MSWIPPPTDGVLHIHPFWRDLISHLPPTAVHHPSTHAPNPLVSSAHLSSPRSLDGGSIAVNPGWDASPILNLLVPSISSSTPSSRWSEASFPSPLTPNHSVETLSTVDSHMLFKPALELDRYVSGWIEAGEIMRGLSLMWTRLARTLFDGYGNYHLPFTSFTSLLLLRFLRPPILTESISRQTRLHPPPSTQPTYPPSSPFHLFKGSLSL